MLMPTWSSLLVAGIAVASSSVVDASLNLQRPLKSDDVPFASYDEGLFTPIEDLGLLSSSEFMVIGHPLFPDYNVRIKKSGFCDGTVR